jgi:hypothetical protein
MVGAPQISAERQKTMIARPSQATVSRRAALAHLKADWSSRRFLVSELRFSGVQIYYKAIHKGNHNEKCYYVSNLLC